MKKFVTTLVLGSALALTACARTDTEADYSYEAQAPYASERTVGDDSQMTADRVFEKRQRK